MKRVDHLLNLSGEFEPFVPSVHLCSLTESMAVLAGLDSVTRQGAVPATQAMAQAEAIKAAAAAAQLVAATLPVPAPTAAAPAPAARSAPVYSSRRKEYLPALQDPQLIAALLAGGPRNQGASHHLQKPAARTTALAATASTSREVKAQPKPRPLGSSGFRSFTVPILSTPKEDET